MPRMKAPKVHKIDWRKRIKKIRHRVWIKSHLRRARWNGRPTWSKVKGHWRTYSK